MLQRKGVGKESQLSLPVWRGMGRLLPDPKACIWFDPGCVSQELAWFLSTTVTMSVCQLPPSTSPSQCQILRSSE